MPAWDSLAPAGEAARRVATIASRTDVVRAMRWLEQHAHQCEQETAAVAAIPAPTFDEGRRAEHVAERLRAIGLSEVQRFGSNNVIGRLGPDRGRGIALVAHLDTVFPNAVDHSVSKRDGRLYGPGIGDNSAGLGGILTAAAALQIAEVAFDSPVWFVGDAGEEGLGDLLGVRQTMEHLEGRLDAVLAIEGTMLGRLGHIAVGSRRLRVRFNGPGGHSWFDFGRPSAVHAAVNAAAAITALPLPKEPRTTFNIGRIEGGEGVNVLAPTAEFLLDMRSMRADALGKLASEVHQVIERERRVSGLEVETDQVGDRPAGSLPRSHPLVEICAAAIERTGLRAESTAGSTDANVPLSMGVPALALGITRGAGTHSLGEWIEIRPMARGVQQLVLIAAALAGG